MDSLPEKQQSVARHYNESIFEYESVRLSQHAAIEFSITKRYLNKYINDGATIADVGVGNGDYAKLLASRGCYICLVDISQRLLEAAYDKLKKLELHKQVIGVHLASATELACLKTESFDALLFLGPFYHLCSLEERQQAVKEAYRILKKNGFLFAAAINHLAYFREQFRNTPKEVLPRNKFHQQLLQDGNVDPVHLPALGYAHFTTCKELRKLFASQFQEIMLTGLESFTSSWADTINNLQPEEIEAWLNLVEETGKTPEGLGMSDHFLYIGRKHLS